LVASGSPTISRASPSSSRQAQLEAAFKNAKPVHFKGNIALVLKYFDKLAPLMPDQDSNLRPAD